VIDFRISTALTCFFRLREMFFFWAANCSCSYIWE